MKPRKLSAVAVVLRTLVILAAILLLAMASSVVHARALLGTSVTNAPVYFVTMTVADDGSTTVRGSLSTLFDTSGGATLDLAGYRWEAITINSFNKLNVSPVPQTRSYILNSATAHITTYVDGLKAEIAAYLVAKGVPTAWFTYEQMVKMTTNAEGTQWKWMKLIWNMRVDAAGNPMYGLPKLIDPDPAILKVTYMPLRVTKDLPAEFRGDVLDKDGQFAEEWGKVHWQLVNGRDAPLTEVSSFDVAGRFDEPDVSDGTEYDLDSGIKCLVDYRHCEDYDPDADESSQVSVQRLLEETGAVLAIVDYVRAVEPVYVDAGDDTLAPKMNWHITERSWVCDVLRNKGVYGYQLRQQIDRFLVSSDGPRPLDTLLIAQREATAVSKAFNYEKTASAAELGGLNPATTIISPIDGDTRRFYQLNELPSSVLNSAVTLSLVDSVTEIGGFNMLVTHWNELGPQGTAQGMSEHLAEVGRIGPDYRYQLAKGGLGGVYGSGTYRMDTFTLEFDLATAQHVKSLRLAANFNESAEIFVNGSSVYNGSSVPTRGIGGHWVGQLFPLFNCTVECAVWGTGSGPHCGDNYTCPTCQTYAYSRCGWNGWVYPDNNAVHRYTPREAGIGSTPAEIEVRGLLKVGRNVITVRTFRMGNKEGMLELYVSGHQCQAARPMPTTTVGIPEAVRTQWTPGTMSPPVGDGDSGW